MAYDIINESHEYRYHSDAEETRLDSLVILPIGGHKQCRDSQDALQSHSLKDKALLFHLDLVHLLGLVRSDFWL